MDDEQIKIAAARLLAELHESDEADYLWSLDPKPDRTRVNVDMRQV